jgi:hypothetical protein
VLVLAGHQISIPYFGTKNRLCLICFQKYIAATS